MIEGGDLKATGLPRPADPDDDLIESTHVDIHPTSWAVSPRDLDRRLQKVLIARQEESIAELEAELSAAESKLFEKESELQWWKDRVQKLTELACLPSKSGMSPGDSFEGPESFLFPVDNACHWKAVYLSDVDISSGHCTTGTPTQLAKIEERQGLDSSDMASGDGSPFGGKRAGMESMLLSEDLASETANDDVCDEFLKAVTDTGTSVGKAKKAGGSDPLPKTGDNKFVSNSEHRPGHVPDNTSDERSSRSVVAQPKQVVYWMDGGSGSSVGMDRSLVGETSKGTLGPENLHGSQLGSEYFEADPCDSITNRSSSRRHSLSSGSVPSGGREVYKGDRSLYMEPMMTANHPRLDHPPSNSSTKFDSDYVDSLIASVPDAADDSNSCSTAGPISRAGANTPVDNIYFQQYANAANNALVSAQEVVVVESGTKVMDKIRHWEGLSKGNSPLAEVAVGEPSAWEAQSWNLESELVHPVVESTQQGENQGEGTLGETLIKRIVEKTRKGSQIVRDAQTVIATEFGDEIGESPRQTASLKSSLKKQPSNSSELDDGIDYLDLSGDAEVGIEYNAESSEDSVGTLSDPVLRMLGPDCGYTGLGAADMSRKVGRRVPSLKKDARRGTVPYYVL